MENNLSNYLFDNLKYQKIRNIVKSDSFKEKVINFKKINSKSLMNNRSRAFLHELITVSKSTSILEIGTYFAGGTKVWADAVKKNNGAIITIDPSEEKKTLIEKEISSWDNDIKDVTYFMPVASSDFFSVKAQSLKDFWFDLCIIDGDHTYTATLSDLINCSKFSGPNAIIIVDDYNQPPVYEAVKDFLKINENWQEINNLIKNNSDFETIKASFNDLPFLILCGPENPRINNKPYSIGKNIIGTIDGLKIELSRPSSNGKIHTRFLIGKIESNGKMQMIVEDVSKVIKNGETNIELFLPESISTKNNFPLTVDAHLLWESNEKKYIELSKSAEFIIS